MTLSKTQLEEITEAHLMGLIELTVPELRDVEYKSELPGRDDYAKKEFLADVCSFANAGGGDLIYGMEEEGGIPTALEGVVTSDPDSDLLRLEQTTLAGITPRIPGLRSQYLLLANGNHVFVIRVPRSFARPHAVKRNEALRFVTRNSAGKYTMDVSEVRNSVLAADTITARMRSFRAGRLADVVAGQTPVDMSGVATVILHVLPLTAFDSPPPSVDLGSVTAGWGPPLQPIGQAGADIAYNFDGLLSRASHGPHGSGGPNPESYALLFRSGLVEAVDSLIPWPTSEQATIPCGLLEGEVLDALERYLALITRLGLDGPVYIGLSLLGVRGYRLAPTRGSFPTGHPVDRSDLVIAEVATEVRSQEREGLERLMRPVFDQVWNAGGYPRSRMYDADGQWLGNRR